MKIHIFNKFFSYAGLTFGVKVWQEPENSVTSLETNSLTLNCNIDDSSYTRMMWYRKQKNGTLELIGYSYGKGSTDIEKAFEKSKYTFSRPEVLKSTLEIKSLEIEDSATYFCATSIAQWWSSASKHYNNLILAEVIWSLWI